MNTFVVYGSRSGNTRLVAEAIADALRPRGSTQASAAETAGRVPAGTDLLLIGGSTEGHGVHPAVTAWLDGLGPDDLRGRLVATFDTRLRWPHWLSGSGATTVARRVAEMGARLIGEPGSFHVTMEPRLVDGELERAAAWAVQIATVAEREVGVSAA